MALLRIRAMLMEWAPRYEEEHGVQLTVPQEITPKMVGTQSEHQFKLKAAESYAFTLFLIELVQQEGSHIDGYDVGAIVESGEIPIRYIATCKSARDDTWTEAKQPDDVS